MLSDQPYWNRKQQKVTERISGIKHTQCHCTFCVETVFLKASVCRKPLSPPYWHWNWGAASFSFYNLLKPFFNPWITDLGSELSGRSAERKQGLNVSVKLYFSWVQQTTMPKMSLRKYNIPTICMLKSTTSYAKGPSSSILFLFIFPIQSVHFSLHNHLCWCLVPLLLVQEVCERLCKRNNQ